MKGRGQLHLEAMICFACFLALLGMALQGMNGIGGHGSEAADAAAAKSNALLCSTLIDSMYSNSIADLAGERLHCTVEEQGKVKSRVGGKEKSAFCIPEKVEIVQAGNRTVISVGLNEHYR